MRIKYYSIVYSWKTDLPICEQSGNPKRSHPKILQSDTEDASSKSVDLMLS